MQLAHPKVVQPKLGLFNLKSAIDFDHPSSMNARRPSQKAGEVQLKKMMVTQKEQHVSRCGFWVSKKLYRYRHTLSTSHPGSYDKVWPRAVGKGSVAVNVQTKMQCKGYLSHTSWYTYTIWTITLKEDSTYFGRSYFSFCLLHRHHLLHVSLVGEPS